MGSDYIFARRALIAIVLVSLVFTLISAKVAGLKIDYLQIVYFLGYFLAVALAAHYYCSRRGLMHLRAVSDAMVCGLLLTVPVVLSTYVVIYIKMPLADDVLSSWDTAIGVDWRKFITFVDQAPVLAHSLGLAYQSFSYQLLLLPIFLAMTGQILRVYQMVIAYALICFASSFISIWFPALGTYSVYEMDAGSLQNINAYYGYFFLEQFNAVRNDASFVFKIQESAGILTFPSVHAGVAALCAWAAWSIRTVRYPLLLLNVLMAAVSHANHYVVDVIAGVLVTAMCVLATKRLTAMRSVADVPSPSVAIPA
jgi:hypothetical protein